MDHEKFMKELSDKCFHCTYSILVEWIADFVGIDPSLIDPKFYDMDSDGIVYDMAPENVKPGESVKKYLTLTAMQSEKSFVPPECKKDDESMRFMGSLAMGVEQTLNYLQKNLIENKSLTNDEQCIIQSLTVKFDQEKYCFDLVFRNNAFVMHHELTKRLQECKMLYEKADEKEKLDLDKMVARYQTDLETLFSIEEIKKNEEVLNNWRDKIKSKDRLFICVENAEDNEELEERLLERLEPVAPVLFETDAVSIVDKVNGILNK